MDEEILTRIESLETKMDKMTGDIEKILQLLEKNNIECQKMGQHIDFIEDVYQRVKMPMNYIFDKVNQMMGAGTGYNEKQIK